MEMVEIIALSMGVAWASGLNLYATIFVLGWLGSTGNLVLPAELQICSDPMVMLVAGFMYCVEFFADKIPGVDTVWDSIHTFIRIPAGAILAAGAVGDLGQGAELAALLLGGGLATATHATKAGGRILMNTSPEPVTNWTASLAEDFAVIAGLWTALNSPLVFLVFMATVFVLMVWLLPKIWRGIKLLYAKIVAFFKREDSAEQNQKEKPALLPLKKDGNSF